MQFFKVDNLINIVIALLVYSLNTNLEGIKSEIKNVGREVIEAKQVAHEAHQRIDAIILNH